MFTDAAILTRSPFIFFLLFSILYLTEVEIEAWRRKGLTQGFPGETAESWGWKLRFLNS